MRVKVVFFSISAVDVVALITAVVVALVTDVLLVSAAVAAGVASVATRPKALNPDVFIKDVRTLYSLIECLAFC